LGLLALGLLALGLLALGLLALGLLALGLLALGLLALGLLALGGQAAGLLCRRPQNYRRLFGKFSSEFSGRYVALKLAHKFMFTRRVVPADEA
jgi:hypothetical protein